MLRFSDVREGRIFLDNLNLLFCGGRANVQEVIDGPSGNVLILLYFNHPEAEKAAAYISQMPGMPSYSNLLKQMQLQQATFDLYMGGECRGARVLPGEKDQYVLVERHCNLPSYSWEEVVEFYNTWRAEG